MTITVGDIYTAFPGFKPSDMIKLCNGNENLNGRTVVSLANIAAFGDKDLSVFVAKKEGKAYTGLLSKGESAEVSAAAGVNKNTGTQEASNNQSQIPMDTSVFDIAAQKKQYA